MGSTAWHSTAQDTAAEATPNHDRFLTSNKDVHDDDCAGEHSTTEKTTRNATTVLTDNIHESGGPAKT